MLEVLQREAFIGKLLEEYKAKIDNPGVSTRFQLLYQCNQISILLNSPSDDDEKLNGLKNIGEETNKIFGIEEPKIRLQGIIHQIISYNLLLKNEESYKFDSILDSEKKIKNSLIAFIEHLTKISSYRATAAIIPFLTAATNLNTIVNRKNPADLQNAIKAFSIEDIEDLELHFILKEIKRFYLKTKLFLVHYDCITLFREFQEFDNLLQLLQKFKIYFGFYSCPPYSHIKDDKGTLDSNKFVGCYTSTMEEICSVKENEDRIFFITPEKIPGCKNVYSAEKKEELDEVGLQIQASLTFLRTMDTVMEKLKYTVNESFFVSNVDKKSKLYGELRELKDEIGGFAPVDQLCARLKNLPEPILNELKRSSHTKELARYLSSANLQAHISF